MKIQTNKIQKLDQPSVSCLIAGVRRAVSEIYKQCNAKVIYERNKRLTHKADFVDFAVISTNDQPLLCLLV